jgi:hypothetical protein
MRTRNRSSAPAATLLAVTVAMGLSAPAHAEETGSEEEAEAAAEAEEEEEDASPLSGMVQVDFTNAYFFRGMYNERASFIAQPWLELYLSLYSSDTGPIRDFTVGAGVWNSVHSEDTGADENPRSLYETDYYPLISIEFPYAVTLTTYYYWYTSPNGAFSTVEELNFRVDWDDSEVMERFPLAPWMNLAIETKRTSFGNNKGVGLQMGVEPTLREFEHDRYPVSLTAPVEMGLSIDNYYEDEKHGDDVFGYLSWGLAASVPLAFMPEGFGDWSASLSAKGFFFGDSLESANDGDPLYPVFTQSWTVEF